MMLRIALSMAGAWSLAMLDRSAAQVFENTEDAFWKSFNAALVAAPTYALLAVLNAPEAATGRVVAVETISYVIGWVIFPLVMVTYTGAAGCADRYFRFISAWNWGIVLQLLLFLLVNIASDYLPVGAMSFVGLIATLAVFFYQGFIAHVTLEVRAGQAAVIVLIDIALGLCLHLVGRWMLQG